ncbi:NAD(P)-dependent alcohol dehydrogenase [Spongiibacter sp. KMU-158]|uniref:NAD(P)-dependent alcohol dehydrogenase n=1 Tax=Spongiibacter pelagi TaxID=2760804 RepID=A0A927C2I6_9GAMM|nr:NAD(P)-dependent alcohol dehydrogenase [Spongiibacter pelagi]MBD2858295.1 NAD(P)-dependent alcohol dehydrogenase [Spongiibacter pelagi]
MLSAKGYAAQTPEDALAPYDFQRRQMDDEDIQLEVLYCGVCHSDIHSARNDWGRTRYPLVPGHEIIGRVVAVGSKVSKFEVGDLAGVGCMVDSCRHCAACHDGDEHYCVSGPTMTYGAPDRKVPELLTYGGYSNNYVVAEPYALKVSPKADLAATAPLLCAGITTWSPLRFWKVGPGMKVGIVGLGGLGHMGLKFANAFGADVTLFTTSANKAEDAKRLGAHQVVVSNDKAAMQANMGSFDFILDTVSAQHDINVYLRQLRRDGTLCLVGLPDQPLALSSFATAARKVVTGSMFGGIRETQEMLDYCAEHGIGADIEMIKMAEINEAFERVLKSDVKYRFVIDMASL